jgi:hypothetical protein
MRCCRRRRRCSGEGRGGGAGRSSVGGQLAWLASVPACSCCCAVPAPLLTHPFLHPTLPGRRRSGSGASARRRRRRRGARCCAPPWHA